MKLKISLLLIALITSISTWADDLNVGDIFIADGVTYKVTSVESREVQVGNGNYESPAIDQSIVGVMEIYSSVTGPDGNNYSITSIGDCAFYSCDCLTSIIIPNSVTTIGVESFYNCAGLTSIILPNSIMSIGLCAFSGCTSLINFNIPNSVISIGDGAFESCTSLSSIIIPNSVINIGEGAFCDCVSLSSISISSSVTSIGGFFVDGCTSLTSIIVDNGNTVYDSRENCNAIIISSTNELIFVCKNTTIPNSVTSIGEYAFYNMTNLTTIDIPYSVTNIGKSAFSGCTGLSSIIIPNSVVSIGNWAFSGCTGLTSIDIPNSVTSLGAFAFNRCTGLSSITISNSLTNLESHAFYGCVNLASVNIPDSVTCIRESAFSGCTGLVSVTIPHSVTTIESSAFYGCSNLKSVNIPNSVTSIGMYCFKGCSALTTVSIPSSINTIDNGSFSFCNSLAEVYCYAAHAPVCNDNYVFYDSNVQSCTLYVPYNALEEYQNNYPWKSFGKIVGMRDSYLLNYIVDGELYHSDELKEGETINPEPEPTKEGYTFSGWSDIPGTMPANDVTITGTFTINKYRIIYEVDGSEYKIYRYEYGATIMPAAPPTKEGYTFSGWSEIPEIMPAKDLTVTGTFTVNKYKLIYKVDGEEYRSFDIEYGASITPIAAPIKEGYDFSGWDYVPETMPAHDVIVNATFTLGITDVMMDSGKVTVFDTMGNQIGKPKKGVNIIRTRDGKTKKVVVK